MGFFLYATGASRQQISMSNHLGYSVSYLTIAGRGLKARRMCGADANRDFDPTLEDVEQTAPTSASLTRLPTPLATPPTLLSTMSRPQYPGTLEILSNAARRRAREVCKEPFLAVYDNINFVWKPGEQVIGRTSKYSYDCIGY